jgi:hypothetical protein
MTAPSTSHTATSTSPRALPVARCRQAPGSSSSVAGSSGASIAYHLAARRRDRRRPVERGRLTNGTTWHAAGLVSQVRGTHA